MSTPAHGMLSRLAASYSRSTSAKRIQYKVALVAGCLNDALQQRKGLQRRITESLIYTVSFRMHGMMAWMSPG